MVSLGGRGVKREPARVRFGAHTKVQRSVSLSPAVDAWVHKEASLSGCSVSEMINRLLSQQLDLRRQLAAVVEGGTDERAPLLQVLLEQVRESLCQAIDGLAGEVRKTRTSLDFVKAMIDRSTHELLAAAAPSGDVERRYDRWIGEVQSLMQPRKGEPS